MSSAIEAESGLDELLAAATAAWREWDPSPAHIELASLSENVVYRVDSEAGDSFVLRIHRLGYHDRAELVSEQLWTAALNAAGIGAPSVVSSLDGRPCVPVCVGSNGEERQVVVSPWVEGEILWDLVEAADGDQLERFFADLGGIAAQIHNQAVTWRPPQHFRRHSFNVDGLLGESPFWGRFWEVPALEEKERHLISTARERLVEIFSNYGQDPQTYSMIHGDLHAHNILKTPEGLHVIDFDDAGFGWHQYELAVAIFDYQSKPQFQAIRDALVAGYRSLRPLSDEALELLPAFLLMRSLALLGWIDGRPELDRRELFDEVRGLAGQQAALLLDTG